MSDKKRKVVELCVQNVRLKPLTGENAKKFIDAFNSSKLNKDVVDEVKEMIEKEGIDIKR